MKSIPIILAERLVQLDRFPVSFCYNGTPVHGFGEEFVLLSRTQGTRGDHGTTETVRLRHAASGAEFVLETCIDPAYGAFEWTLWIHNPTDRETGVFSDLNAIDMDFVGDSPILGGIAGDCGRDYVQALCA